MDYPDDVTLDQLSADIDAELLRWLTTYEMAPLHLSAVVLARLAWLAKLGDFQNDFLELLEHPKKILDQDDSPTKVVH